MSENLLPCPFCSSAKIGVGASQEMDDAGDYIEDGRQWTVLCENCGASSSLHSVSEADAIAAWNTRHPAPSAGSPASAVTDALFPADVVEDGGKCITTYDASLNLQGVLYDLKRYKSKLRPPDDVCIRTIERVVEQLEQARAALTGPFPTTAMTASAEPVALAKASEAFIAELARQERVRSYRDGDCIIVDCRLTIGDFRRLCAALSAAPVSAWQDIETAPMDVEVLMGWWANWPELHFEMASGLYGSTRGGWLHGQAKFWQPLPTPPAPPRKERGSTV